MEVLLVKSSIVVDAVLPIIFFEGKVVVEDVLAFDHFAVLPLSFVEAALNEAIVYVGIDQFAFAMEVALYEVPLVYYTVVHF